MNRFTKMFIAACSLVCGLSQAAMVSPQRIEAGISVAREFLKENPTAAQDAVVAAIEKKLSRQFPELSRTPSQALLTDMDALRDYDQKFQKVMDEEFPVPSNRELLDQAAQKYPLYSRGDNVKVYFTKGNTIETCSGKIVAIEEGRVIIGSRRIFFSQMEGIEGNDAELLKFMPEENQKARDAFIAAEQKRIADARADFKLNKHKYVEQKLIDNSREINEKNGYTFYDNSWLTPDVLAMTLAQSAVNSIEDERYALLNQSMKGRREAIESQIAALDIHYNAAPPGTVITPEVLKHRAEQQALEQERQAKLEKALREQQEKEEKARLEKLEAQRIAKLEAEKKAQEEAELAQKEAEENQQLLAKEAADKKAREAAEKAKTSQLPPDIPITSLSMPALFICAGSIIVIAICMMCFLRHKKKVEEDAFKKFFEGKGKLQKNFWDMAAADPENFKYVAYMFPSLKEAQAALGKLSYFRDSAGGLRCLRDLQYGMYEHLNGAVCFVGGLNFTYALWREASAVLPELPNAQYFKVSTEPVVQLDIPDLDQLRNNLHVNIEDLGIEETQGENGEFNRLYRYRTSNKEDALNFLEHFDIHEAGIFVHVETPEGIYGKDENGVFTLDN